MLLASAGQAARPPKVPADAPYCALPNARQVFLSPMGEPFRAAATEAYPSAAWAGRADKDGDGWISKAEMDADAARFFDLLDTDRDGRLTPDEIAAYERLAPEVLMLGSAESRREAPVFPVQRANRRVSYYGGAMGAGRFSWLNVPQPVAAADADMDRLVTRAEFIAAAGRRFASLASADAGRFRVADLPKTPAQQAAEGPCHPRPKPKTASPAPTGRPRN